MNVHTERKLINGAHSIGLGAIAAGCRYFAGYPITPQTELLEYMSQALPQSGGVFQQLNDEISSIMACFGASAAGARAMTASVGPGLTLMIDGIANAAGAELPMVIGVLTRAHVGVSSGLLPAQSDIRMLKGGGNGDYHIPILVPASCQEAAELTFDAFYLAEKYLTPVFVAIDGVMANMMETVSFDPSSRLQNDTLPYRPTLKEQSDCSVMISSYFTPDIDTYTCFRLQEKYQKMKEQESRFEGYMLEDADYIIVAFGVMARIAKQVVQLARDNGIKLGLFRPITIFPFPEKQLYEFAKKARGILVTEMNFGQILIDVKLAVSGICPISFYGHPAEPIIPTTLLEQVKNLAAKGKTDV